MPRHHPVERVEEDEEADEEPAHERVPHGQQRQGAATVTTTVPAMVTASGETRSASSSLARGVNSLRHEGAQAP